MIGSEGVARGLLTLLRDNMPSKLSDMRHRLGATVEKDLPDIQRWAAHDLDELEVGGFPAVLVMEVESTGRFANQTQEIATSFDEYTFEYVMRVYVWAMGDSAGDTALKLKRYVQAVEEIALGRKLVYQSDIEQAAVDVTSIRHSYSDAAVDDTNQVLTAGYVEIRVRTLERVDTLVPPYGPMPLDLEVSAGYQPDLDTGVV